jgi:hypothetical protein
MKRYRASADEQPTELAVYDGTRCLGRVVPRSGKWLAYAAADDRPIDKFSTRKAATDALVAARRNISQ